MAKILNYSRTLDCARRLLVVWAMACLAAPTLCLAQAAPRSTPLVYMGLTRRDFGDVFAGETLEQVFPVRNDGNGTLEMEEKVLTGQSAPAPSSGLVRAGAFRAGGAPGRALVAAAMRLAAPT